MANWHPYAGRRWGACGRLWARPSMELVYARAISAVYDELATEKRDDGTLLVMSARIEDKDQLLRSTLCRGHPRIRVQTAASSAGGTAMMAIVAQPTRGHLDSMVICMTRLTWKRVTQRCTVARAGISTPCKIRGKRRSCEGCKNVGRRGGFDEGLKRCVSRGRRRDFLFCDVDAWRLGRWIRGRVANFMSRKCYLAGIISRGSYTSSYALAQLFRGRRNTFEASTSKSLKRIVILRPIVWSTCHFWRTSRKNSSFVSFKISFLKELSQKSFGFELQSFIFEGNLAEKEISDSLESQTVQLTTKSLESQIIWQPNQLNLKPFDIQITWIPNQLTTKITWTSNHVTTNSLESQIRWGPNQLDDGWPESEGKTFIDTKFWRPRYIKL